MGLFHINANERPKPGKIPVSRTWQGQVQMLQEQIEAMQEEPLRV